MAVATETIAKAKQHQIYRTKDGQRVPGVTTVLQVLNKPALIGWANRMGLKGIDTRKHVDGLADIGTLAHYLIQCHLSNKDPVLSDYSQNQIDRAENSLLSFFEWEKSHELLPTFLEKGLVSEKHSFGGTVDCYGTLDGVPTLIDFKTCKGLYPEQSHQLAAYELLLVENGHEVRGARILRVGRDESEGFEEKIIKNMTPHADIFMHCVEIHKLQKELRRVE